MTESNPYEAPQSTLQAPSREAVPKSYRPATNSFARFIALSCCQALAADLTVGFAYGEIRAALVFGVVYFLLTIGLIILAAVKRDEIMFFIELILLLISLVLIANHLMESWPEL